MPFLVCKALRVSLEEQRQRQEEEARRVQQESLDQMQTDQGESLPGVSWSYIFVVGGDTSGLAQATAAELPYNPVSCYHIRTAIGSVVSNVISHLQAMSAGVSVRHVTVWLA